MKLLAALLLIGATSAPALAGGPATGGYRSRGGYAEQEKCFRKEYREEYVPGTMSSPGYVRTYKKLKHEHIESMKLAVEQADIRWVHPDKMEEFAEYLVQQARTNE